MGNDVDLESSRNKVPGQAVGTILLLANILNFWAGSRRLWLMKIDIYCAACAFDPVLLAANGLR